jgi:hypothetical protein
MGYWIFLSHISLTIPIWSSSGRNRFTCFPKKFKSYLSVRQSVGKLNDIFRIFRKLQVGVDFGGFWILVLLIWGLGLGLLLAMNYYRYFCYSREFVKMRQKFQFTRRLHRLPHTLTRNFQIKIMFKCFFMFLLVFNIKKFPKSKIK